MRPISSRKPHATKEMIRPTTAAISRSATKLRLRNVATGSTAGAAGGATVGAPTGPLDASDMDDLAFGERWDSNEPSRRCAHLSGARRAADHNAFPAASQGGVLTRPTASS